MRVAAVFLRALALLLVGLTFAILAPTAHADCPHNDKFDHPHCDGGSDGMIVFVTSNTYDGGLNPDPNSCGTGVAGGDCICQYHADQAGLSGVFLAWLTDNTGSPSTTFTQSAVPYVRVDGVMVALSWADLVDGTILAAIEVDEQGNHPGQGTQIWTGTGADGTSGGSDPITCFQWTSSGSSIGVTAIIGKLKELCEIA